MVINTAFLYRDDVKDFTKSPSLPKKHGQLEAISVTFLDIDEALDWIAFYVPSSSEVILCNFHEEYTTMKRCTADTFQLDDHKVQQPLKIMFVPGQQKLCLLDGRDALYIYHYGVSQMQPLNIQTGLQVSGSNVLIWPISGRYLVLISEKCERLVGHVYHLDRVEEDYIDTGRSFELNPDKFPCDCAASLRLLVIGDEVHLTAINFWQRCFVSCQIHDESHSEMQTTAKVVATTPEDTDQLQDTSPRCTKLPGSSENYLGSL